MLKVKLIAHTPQPEKVVAAAAKLCYSSAGVDDLLDGLTPENSRAFVQKLASLGHESPTEHASFTFAIEGVSRSLLAQITRHRIASYSVQSQRYVNLHQFRYVTPPEIEGDEDALAAFRAAMDAQAQQYQQLARALAAQMGRPSMSSQAVGGAVGHNPISIIIPCHRVVGSGGSLTGYAGGIAAKLRLLEHEGVELSRLSVPKRGTAL